MNKPSQQQPGPAKSTSGDRTQTNTPPSSERKESREKTREAAPPATSPDEIRDPRADEDDAQAPLRVEKHNGDGARR